MNNKIGKFVKFDGRYDSLGIIINDDNHIYWFYFICDEFGNNYHSDIIDHTTAGCELIYI